MRKAALAAIAATIAIIAPAALSATTTPEAANIVSKKVASPPVIDGKLTDSCWKKAERTAPLELLGHASEDVYGVWLKAEDKFSKTPTTASVCSDDKYLYVAIDAKMPAGLQPKCKVAVNDGPVWGDDCVELFLSPCRGQGFYQIIVNSKGVCTDLSNVAPKWSSDIGWNSCADVKATSGAAGFTVEMRIPFASLGSAPHADGDMWGVNFCREGATCDGLATWAPVGQMFANPARFGYLVFGSRSAFYSASLKAAQQELKALSKPKSSTAAADASVNALRSQVAKADESQASWLRVLGAVRDAKDAIRQVAFAGKNYLIWDRDAWATLSPDMQIETSAKDLTSIGLFSGQKMRAETGFAMSNLSDKPLMGRFLVQNGSSEAAAIPQKSIRFYRAAYIELSNGAMLPDMLLELPAANIVEIPARTTVLMLMQVDTTDLQAGKHNCDLVFLPSYSGFDKASIKLDLDIAPIDMSAPAIRQFAYVSNYMRYASPAAAKDMVDHGVNAFVYVPGNNDQFPRFDADGKIVSCDYALLDKMVETMIAAGVPKDQLSAFIYTVSSVEHYSSMPHNGKPQTKYGTDHWAKCLRSMAISLRDHLFTKYGLDYSRLYFYTVDEPDGDPADSNSHTSQAIRTAAEIKAADPKLLTFTDPLSFDGSGKWIQAFIDSHDVLEPNGSNMEAIGGYTNRLAKCGKQIWQYKVCGKDTEPVTYRNMFWYQAKHGLALSCPFWAYDAHSSDPFNSYDSKVGAPNINTDYGVVYPAAQGVTGDERIDRPIPSRRWEAWYQGVLDARVITRCRELLSDAGKSGKDTTSFEAAYKAAIDSACGNGMADMDRSRQQLMLLALQMQQALK